MNGAILLAVWELGAILAILLADFQVWDRTGQGARAQLGLGVWGFGFGWRAR